LSAAWPIAARAQQTERVRRIGVLTPLGEVDPEGQVRISAFLKALQQLGWTDGSNLRIDYRRTLGDAERTQRYAVELVARAPDVILAIGANVAALLQATNSVPIVFVAVPDPVGAGFVENLARPGGNATGFTTFEYSIGAKWLELLKEIAPNVKRAAVIRNTEEAAGTAQFAAVQAVSPALGVEVSPIGMRDMPEIERATIAFARGPKGGLIVTANAFGVVHRELIIALAARHQLPAIYPQRLFVTEGGLISYGPNFVDQYRQAAGYVDRILRGEKPADLPVQAPTKYELAINLKSAKALGIDVPPTLLARADEVTE
jgi:putative tryptophan/tyrosine transport system substrate-binding protein